MLLIVTRPIAQATPWVRELQLLGQQAQALPLIAIAPPADPAPVRAVWQRLDSFALVIFVSANAVQHFFALGQPRARWPGATDAGSTGPGTSAALRAMGVPSSALIEPAHDATSFDSEALWDELSADAWGGRRVLVVRGEDGRDWLAETLRARGATVEFVAAYARQPPQLDRAEQALLRDALDEPAQHVWLFSSSESIAHLRHLARGTDWARSSAIASHPRIAQAARSVGFGNVALTRPSPAAVAQQAAVWRAERQKQAQTQAQTQALRGEPPLQSSAP